jgi:hypothetical protein
MEASWVARGLEYFCALRTPANDPFSFFQLEFSPIRTTERNTYAFRAERDDITPSLRSITDSATRPHIDRLEELITSASLPGAYSDEGVIETEEAKPALELDDEIEIENPWPDSDH